MCSPTLISRYGQPETHIINLELASLFNTLEVDQDIF